ncbi:MAG: DUF805 domain-containing protein [Rhizobiaceae bacterium]
MADSPDYFWLFFKLSGRIGRAAYFLGSTFVWLTQIFLLYRFAMAEEGSGASQTLAMLFMASAFIGAWSNFALTAKRLHDFGKPTAFALAAFIVGYILVIGLSFIKGDPGPNRYGPRSDAPA